MSKRTLGKGLSALIGDLDMGDIITKPIERAVQQNSSSQSELMFEADRKNVVKQVSVNSLLSGKFQPRNIFNELELKELSESIALNGILQPVLVRQMGINYEIIAGERRWRAAKLAGLTTIPVLVKDFDDKQTLEVALIENIQRQDLTVIEEAEGYKRLIGEFNYTQEELAAAVGKSRSHIANLLRILSLPDEIKEMIIAGTLSMGHARALVSVENNLDIARQVIAKSLNVRQTESLIKSLSATKNKNRSYDFSQKVNKDHDLEAIENSLSSLLGLKVKIEDKKQGGAVIVEFQNLEQLDLIIQVLSGNKTGF